MSDSTIGGLICLALAAGCGYFAFAYDPEKHLRLHGNNAGSGLMLWVTTKLFGNRTGGRVLFGLGTLLFLGIAVAGLTQQL